MSRVVGRLVAAVALTAAASAVVPLDRADAAPCPTSSGVTVVVDFHQLGGGVQSGCVADGGGQTASRLFPEAGFRLTYVQRQPGFVCRVSGKPADDPCVNTPPDDAYWGLWWSDGRSGEWNYSTTGVGSLRVPDGGYVAFSWNGSSSRTPPGMSPTPRPTPSPSPSPEQPSHTAQPSQSPHPTQPSGTAPSGGGAQPSGPSSTSGPTSATAAAPSRTARAEESSSPTSRKPDRRDRPQKHPATPSESASDRAGTPASEGGEELASSDPADPGVPWWGPLVAIAALFTTAGVGAVLRHRRGSGT